MAPLTVQAIDRFIGSGNPLAQAGGAQTLLRATGGNLAGAAFLAALARKESSFGAKVGKFTNNFWGWGVHLGPSVYTSPTVEEGARKVWTGLQSGLYKGAGLTTPSAIIQRYAPPSENNTGLYQSQVNQWFTQLGLSPTTNIFSGATVPAPAGGSSPAASRTGSAAPGFTPNGAVSLTPRTQKAIQSYIIQSQRDVQAGRAPRDPFGLISRLASERGVAAPAPAGRPGVHSQSDGHDHGPGFAVDGDYSGYAAGPVDSGKAFAGGEGGNWGGAMPLALALARSVGATPSSQKRSTRLTASGNPSDHWVGSTRSYATDLPTSGAAGDALLKKLSASLGVPLRAGIWNNVNIGGYRYQIGWKTKDHFDHIHVGVKKL